jgi:hypothetical protein
LWFFDLESIQFGDLISAYPVLSGGSKRREQSVLPGYHSRQVITMGAHVLLPLAVNSKSEIRFIATAGIRTCDLRDACAPFCPLGQVPLPKWNLLDKFDVKQCIVVVLEDIIIFTAKTRGRGIGSC